jgi:hypothetical protein
MPVEKGSALPVAERACVESRIEVDATQWVELDIAANAAVTAEIRQVERYALSAPLIIRI